ncbi:MAG: DUF2608 domain-containing protein [bacterium]|nr:DUF2608 domain-containing protein [bacterium]
MARIAIDIDDTLTNSSIIVREYAILHEREYSNDNILTSNLDNMLRGFTKNEAIAKFYKDYGIEMADKAQIKQDAREVINKLRKDGHEIVIITARSDNYYKDSYTFCKNYLDRNEIKFDKLITSQLYKVKACQEENIDIMIDDGVDTCDNLNSIGIKAFLFTGDLNLDKDTISERVYSWNEVYEKINLYLNNK